MPTNQPTSIYYNIYILASCKSVAMSSNSIRERVLTLASGNMMQWPDSENPFTPYNIVRSAKTKRRYKPTKRRTSTITLRRTVNELEEKIKLMDNVLDKHRIQMNMTFEMLMALERKSALMENIVDYIKDNFIKNT